MKTLINFLILVNISVFTSNGQTTIDRYSLKGNNLHKNVRKVIKHYYKYDDNSGGFVKKGVYIDMFNDDGLLIESLSQYYGTYSKDKPAIKTQYNYDRDGKIISTQDISSGYRKYSSYLNFTYDRKDNLIKKETIYKDGKKYIETYTYDRNNRITDKKKTTPDGKLTSETKITHKGRKRTEVKTNYNTKDGSISGQYTTVFDNDVKIKSSSKSKWANSKTTYEYDDKSNLSRSIYTNDKGQPSITTNKYIYDKKGNWIKKFYKNGKYSSFYFREIYFKNDNVTGSTNFDKKFINRNGNFENVVVVPLKKKKLNFDKNKNLTSNNLMPLFTSKQWKYNYAFYKKELKNWKGEIDLTVSNGNKMKVGSKIIVGYKYPGEERYTVTYTIKKYFNPSEKYKYHEWKLDLQGRDKDGALILYNTKQILKGKDVKIEGLLQIPSKNNEIVSYYLEKNKI